MFGDKRHMQLNTQCSQCGEYHPLGRPCVEPEKPIDGALAAEQILPPKKVTPPEKETSANIPSEDSNDVENLYDSRILDEEEATKVVTPEEAAPFDPEKLDTHKDKNGAEVQVPEVERFNEVSNPTEVQAENPVPQTEQPVPKTDNPVPVAQEEYPFNKPTE